MTTPSQILNASLDHPRRCMGRWVNGSGGHIVWSHDCSALVEWVDAEGGDAFCDQHLPRVGGEIHPTFRGHVRRVEKAELDQQGDVDLDELESAFRDVEPAMPVDGVGVDTIIVPRATALRLLSLARRALAPTPDVHRLRSEMCERFLREHGEALGSGYNLPEHYQALRALMKEFGLGK